MKLSGKTDCILVNTVRRKQFFLHDQFWDKELRPEGWEERGCIGVRLV
jgi:hypothetical protein